MIYIYNVQKKSEKEKNCSVRVDTNQGHLNLSYNKCSKGCTLTTNCSSLSQWQHSVLLKMILHTLDVPLPRKRKTSQT